MLVTNFNKAMLSQIYPFPGGDFNPGPKACRNDVGPVENPTLMVLKSVSSGKLISFKKASGGVFWKSTSTWNW